MTFLAVSIAGDVIKQVRRDMAEAVNLGADLIELRVDQMPGVADADILSLRGEVPDGVPIILTIRSATEGGAWSDSEEERIDRLIELIPVADYVDLEFAAWLGSDDVRRRIRLALDASRKGPSRRKLILSCHDFAGRPRKLTKLHLDLLGTEDCDVPKLAWRARTIRDNFEAFSMMGLRCKPVDGRAPGSPIVVCMGPDGLLSRVLARKFGAFATFASLRPGRESAPGQLSISQLRDLYRWDSLDPQTDVYGVIGDAVEHSLSPQLHNAAFAEAGLNAVYLPMKVNSGYESFAAFLVEVLGRPETDFRGFSVTIPHKENALRFIRRVGGKVEDAAERIGAVNTITVGTDGKLAGFNTDHDAAMQAIATGLERPLDQMSGMSVAVLGAGGVARAIVAGLCAAGAKVTVYNRTAERAEALAREFSCDSAPWDHRTAQTADLIVNCTSVGMGQDADASPMPADALRAEQAVFDTIYNPSQTKLLREAAGRGCTTINGLTMFALQAAAQYNLWTGKTLPSAFFLDRAGQAGG